MEGSGGLFVIQEHISYRVNMKYLPSSYFLRHCCRIAYIYIHMWVYIYICIYIYVRYNYICVCIQNIYNYMCMYIYIPILLLLTLSHMKWWSFISRCLCLQKYRRKSFWKFKLKVHFISYLFSSCLYLEPGLAYFFWKGPDGKYFWLRSHTVPASATQLSCVSTRAALDNT